MFNLNRLLVFLLIANLELAWSANKNQRNSALASSADKALSDYPLPPGVPKPVSTSETRLHKQFTQAPWKEPSQYTPEHLAGPKCRTSDGLFGVCNEPAACFYQFNSLDDYSNHVCKLNNNLNGVCCPLYEQRMFAGPKANIQIPKNTKPIIQIPHGFSDSLVQASSIALKNVELLQSIERSIVQKGNFQKKGSLEDAHQAFFGEQCDENRKLTKDGLVHIESTLEMARIMRLKPSEAKNGLRHLKLHQTPAAEYCLSEPRTCGINAGRYRTIDGTCNNPVHPLWGRSLTQYNRILPPVYADGLNMPRVAQSGSPLPSVRALSTRLAKDLDVPDRSLSLMFMHWGQFVAHDITLGVSTRMDTDAGQGLVCCPSAQAKNNRSSGGSSSNRKRLRGRRETTNTGHNTVERTDGKLKGEDQLVDENNILSRSGSSRLSTQGHPACAPISIPTNDPFYAQFNRTCMNFVRNAASPTYGCHLGPREQANQVTHFIDASMVYGSTDSRARLVRSFKKGELKYQLINNRVFMPADTRNLSIACAIPANSPLKCFLSGDVRANQQAGLSVLQTIFLREHNRLAQILSKLNPHWNDQETYEEARRIVSAQTQHITYNEYLPLVIPRSVMGKFDLLLKPDGYSLSYDMSLEPNILNEFAGAAYRFHSMVQGLVKQHTNQGRVREVQLLRQLFNNPTSLYRAGALDEYINGLTGEASQTYDPNFTEEITNHLFQPRNQSDGLDLVSINIQRGRDHGLAPYNSWRKICGFRSATSFKEFDTFFRPGGYGQILSQFYETPDDVDLFVGIILEKIVPGGLIGETATCLVSEQFRRLKLGDRFWYENGDQPNSFTAGQLTELRRTSLAAILCENSDDLKAIQPLALLLPSKWNPRIDCDKIPKMSLKPWKHHPDFF